MKNTSIGLASLGVASALLGCGDALQCGEGTHDEAGACVASLSPQCGLGTRLENGSCVPDEGGGAVCGEGTHLQDGTCVPDITRDGNAARFYDVTLTAPADIAGISNGSLHQSFMTGETLLFIGAYQPGPQGLRLYGGVGTLAADGSYALDRAASFDTSANVSGGVLTSEPFILQMQAFGAVEPIVLVDTVITDGVMDAPEGISLVESGKLLGVLTPESAQRVYVEQADLTLYELLIAVSAPPDVDHDGDGSNESWNFGITFSTVPVWLF